MPSAIGLRHPASASCLGRHLRLAGRCPNNSSLFPPLAAVVVVAPKGGALGRPGHFSLTAGTQFSESFSALRAPQDSKTPPTPCQKHSIEGGLFSKSRFHSGLSLKADNGGHPRCDTQLPAACCPGALHAAVCKQASSQRPVLSAQTMQRYSARINAFILLPLYYSGAAQGSQGGTKTIQNARR